MYSKIIYPIIALSMLFVLGCEDDPASSDDDVIDQSIIIAVDGGASATFEPPSRMQAAYMTTGVAPVDDNTFYLFALEGEISSIFITFRGNTAGTYDVSYQDGYSDDSYTFNIMYTKSATESYGISTGGSVTVTEVGAVGELVVGTFNATIAIFDGGEPTEETVQVTGTFSVLRSADGTSL